MEDEKAERPWPVVRLVRRAGAALEEEERRAVDPPEGLGVVPSRPRPGWNVRETVRPGERERRPVNPARSDDAPAGPPPRQPETAIPEPAHEGPVHDEWLRSWHRQEIGWLSGRVEQLERMLRWRTWGLGAGLVLSGLLNILLIGFVLLSPGGSEILLGMVKTGPSAEVPINSPSTTGVIEPAPPAGPSAASAEDSGWPMIAGEDVPLPPDPQSSAQPAESVVSADGGVGTGQRPEAPAAEAATAVDALATGPIENTESQALQDMLATVAAADRVSEADAAGGEGEAATGDGPEDGRYVATAVVYLRAAPSQDSDVVNVLAPGEEVQRIGGDGDWLQVEFTDFKANQFIGYVPSLYLSPVEPTPQAE